MGQTDSIANQGLMWLFGQFGTWVNDWFFEQISEFADALLDFISQATGVFWEVPAITIFLDFSAWVNMVVLVVALLFLCMDIAEQNGRINWAIVFANLCKGFFFVLFNRYLGLLTYEITESAVRALNIDVQTTKIPFLSSLTDMQIGLSMIIIVITLIAFIAFFIMAMLRNGSLFVQILSSSFYIPDIVRGDTGKMDDWMRTTIAISATYFIQYVLFYIGLNYAVELSGSAFITTFTCWLTMFFVPKILERFGYSSGASSVFSMAGGVASAGVGFVK